VNRHKINKLQVGTIFDNGNSAMTKKMQNELAAILQEGSDSLKEMRRGLENAIAELRVYYRKTLNRNPEKPRLKQYREERHVSRSNPSNL